MTIASSQVYLYVADQADYQIALGATAASGISSGNIITDFTSAWNTIAGGNSLVIAVGGNANAALYYNPCGWGGHASGSTPFDYASQTTTSLPGANYYINGAAGTGQETLKLVTMIAYHALNGTYPNGYGTSLPSTTAAVNSCVSSMYSSVSCPC